MGNELAKAFVDSGLGTAIAEENERVERVNAAVGNLFNPTNVSRSPRADP